MATSALFVSGMAEGPSREVKKATSELFYTRLWKKGVWWITIGDVRTIKCSTICPTCYLSARLPRPGKSDRLGDPWWQCKMSLWAHGRCCFGQRASKGINWSAHIGLVSWKFSCCVLCTKGFRRHTPDGTLSVEFKFRRKSGPGPSENEIKEWVAVSLFCSPSYCFWHVGLASVDLFIHFPFFIIFKPST